MEAQEYKKLVEALRYCVRGVCKNCSYFDKCKENGTAMDQLHNDAADAIEELQETLEAVQKNSGINFRMWEEAQAEVERLQAELLKRGEIVRCGECKWYAPLDRKRPFFCPVMDCATGVMEDDFCSHGERRAKMEVQDETEI